MAMMEPAQLRQLVSGSGTYAQKLELARSLAQQLLPQRSAKLLASLWSTSNANDEGAAQQQVQLPAVVHAHYMQAVCDWATSTLSDSAAGASGHVTKSSGEAHSKRKQHRKEKVDAAPAPPNTNTTPAPSDQEAELPYMSARLWWLAACLSHAGARRVPASIIGAATQACRQLGVATTDRGAPVGASWDWQTQSQLLAGIHELLAAAAATPQAARGGIQAEWQPSLDSLSGLLAALLKAQQTAARQTPAEVRSHGPCNWQGSWQQAWSALTHLTLCEMLSSVQGNQNPRKALAAVLNPSLFHSLLLLAFPEPISDTALSFLLNTEQCQSASSKQNATRPESRYLSQQLAATEAQLHVKAKQVLEAALLHETHVPGIVETSAQLMQPLLTTKPLAASKQQAAVPETQQSEEQAGQKLAKLGQQGQKSGQPGQLARFTFSAVRSYHASIFQALCTAVTSSQPAVRSAALSCLPWFLNTACKAVARLRRLQLADARTALRAALQRSSKSSSKQGCDEEQTDGQDIPLRHAEFHIFAVLCCMILSLQPAAADSLSKMQAATGVTDAVEGSKGKKRRQGQSPVQPALLSDISAADGGATWHDQRVDVMHGVTLLLASAKAAHAYEPTQDYTQTQRTFLTTLMQHILDTTTPAAVIAQQQGTAATHNSNASGAGAVVTKDVAAPFVLDLRKDPHAAAAVCGVMCTMLQLEYRALSCSLPALWALLTHTAQSSILGLNTQQDSHPHSGKTPGDAHRPHGGTSLELSQSTHPPSNSSHAGLSVAIACMQQLIGAYTELRQLQVLLDSLYEALQGGGQQTQAATADMTLSAACLARIVSDHGVQEAVHRAVSSLPPGQYATLLRSFAAHIPKLSSSHNGTDAGAHTASHTLLAAAQLAVTCITATRLELPTAAPVASACSQLVAALAPSLLNSLAQVCKKQSRKKKQAEDAASRALQLANATLLLRVYQAAVMLHTRCAAVNPEIAPLPGQGATWAAMTQQTSPTGNAAVDAAAACYWLQHSFFSAATPAVADPTQSALHHLVTKAATKSNGCSSAAEQAAEGAPDTQSATICDPLLLLAQHVLQPTLQAIFQVPQSGQVGGSQDTQSLPATQQDHTMEDGTAACSIAQAALAATVISCVTHYVGVLKEQAAYLRAACTHMEQRGSMQQMLRSVQQSLAAANAVLLPSWAWQPTATGTGAAQEANESDSAHVTEKGEPACALPPWLFGRVAPAGCNFACASAEQVLLQASGGSPSVHHDSVTVLTSRSGAVDAARSLLVQEAWAGSLKCLSSCSCKSDMLPSELAQPTLQLMLSSSAAVLSQCSSSTGESRSKRSVEAERTQEDVHSVLLLRHVGRTALDVLQLPNWQMQPAIYRALPTAVLHVSAAVTKQCAAATAQAVHMQVGIDGCGHVRQLLAAMERLLRGDVVAAGKKASKAIKQQAQQLWSDSLQTSAQDAGGDVDDRPPSKKAKHSASQGHTGAQQVAVRQPVQQYNGLLKCFQHSLQVSSLHIQDVRMLMNLGWLSMGTIVELLDQCGAYPQGRGMNDKDDDTACIHSLLLDALLYSLQWSRSLQRTFQQLSRHAVLQTHDASGQEAASTHLLVPYKRCTKWLHALALQLHHRYCTREQSGLALQAMRCVVACAALLEGCISMELHAQRCENSDGSSAAADTAGPAHAEFQQAVSAAQQLLKQSSELLRDDVQGGQAASTDVALHASKGKKRKSLASGCSQVVAFATRSQAVVLSLLASSYLTAAVQQVDALCMGGGVPSASATAARAASASTGSTDKAVKRRRKEGTCMAAACVGGAADVLTQVEHSLRMTTTQVLAASTAAPSHLVSSYCIAYAAVARMAAAGQLASEQLPGTTIVSQQAIMDMLQAISKAMTCSSSQDNADGSVSLHAGERTALISLLQALAQLSVKLPATVAAHTQSLQAGPSLPQDISVGVTAGQACKGTQQLAIRLLDTHVMLVSQCCPPCVAGMPNAQQHGSLAGLMFDLPAGSWRRTSRSMLLASMRYMLQNSGVAQFNALLHHIIDKVQQSISPAVPAADDYNFGGKQQPAACTDRLPLLPLHLFSMLVACEVEAGPYISQCLSRTCHNIIPLLTQLLLTLASNEPAPSVGSTAAHITTSFADKSQQLAGVRTQMAAKQDAGACWAAAVCVALRILESFVGRPTTFRLNDGEVSNILGSVGWIFHATSPATSQRMQVMSGPLSAACSLMASSVRHRSHTARNCAPLLVDSMRGMLLCLVKWAAQCSRPTSTGSMAMGVLANADGDSSSAAMAGDDTAVATLTECCAAISRVYEALVLDKEHVAAVRMYCMCMVADYITHVAMALPPAKESEDSFHEVVQPGQGGLLPGPAALALRSGVLLLLSALGPGELQALHVALGPGWAGARRGVLAALRKEWERSVKYTGKV